METVRSGAGAAPFARQNGKRTIRRLWWCAFLCIGAFAEEKSDEEESVFRFRGAQCMFVMWWRFDEVRLHLVDKQ